LIREQFDNLTQVSRATCPTFIVHGQQDEVIGYHHAEQLREASAGKPLMFVRKQNMTHNQYRLNEDLLRPLAAFFHEIKMDTGFEEGQYADQMVFLSDISYPPGDKP
jgi:fermentation-respiration switch protein FrsA (DUF1100 family)